MTHVTDIGSRIREAREQRGLTIRDIASTTKISTTALNAIEHNDFDRLPGGVFRRAYVRAFATEVGLDADELTREYLARFELEHTAVLPLPHRAHRFVRLRAFEWLLMALVAFGILIGGAVVLERAQLAHESPDERSTLNAVEADRLEDAVVLTDEPVATAEVAMAAHAAASEASARAALRLEIRANGPCWVSAVADGERAVYRLMQPGERSLVEARSWITLRVGDAGAIAYSINGTTGRPLGVSGEAVTIRITTDSLAHPAAEPTKTMPAKGATARIRSEFVERRVEASRLTVAP